MFSAPSSACLADVVKNSANALAISLGSSTNELAQQQSLGLNYCQTDLPTHSITTLIDARQASFKVTIQFLAYLIM